MGSTIYEITRIPEYLSFWCPIEKRQGETVFQVERDLVHKHRTPCSSDFFVLLDLFSIHSSSSSTQATVDSEEGGLSFGVTSYDIWPYHQ